MTDLAEQYALTTPITELPADTRRRAALYVCGRAHNTDDARLLLWALGLAPYPPQPETVEVCRNGHPRAANSHTQPGGRRICNACETRRRGRGNG